MLNVTPVYGLPLLRQDVLDVPLPFQVRPPAQVVSCSRQSRSPLCNCRYRMLSGGLYSGKCPPPGYQPLKFAGENYGKGENVCKDKDERKKITISETGQLQTINRFWYHKITKFNTPNNNLLPVKYFFCKICLAIRTRDLNSTVVITILGLWHLSTVI